MKKIDLKYKNKEGITLKKVLDTIKKNAGISKKDLATKVKASKSIDTLINKLIDAELIEKTTKGRAVMFSIPIEEIESQVMNEPMPLTSEESDKRLGKPTKTKPSSVTKAKPKSDKTPTEIDKINKQTSVMAENHEIKSLVEIEEVKEEKETTPEIDEEALDILKKEMESKTGKEVTAILHHRNEPKERKKQKDVEEIYAETIEHEEELDIDNPYRFVLNFFTTTINGEISTPHFRRRDNYVVKSIYNKFKTMCDKIEEYNTDQQHMPFYRVISVNREEMVVKMYHVDMNRMIRGVHDIFKIDPNDIPFIFGFKGAKNEY